MAKLLDSGVNLSGLGQFRGGGMSPTYGLLIGGGVTATTLVVARHIGGARHAEWIALGLGAATTAAMAAMPSTRRASIASGIATLLAAGLPLLGKALGEATVPAAVVPPEVKGLGFPQARALNGLGIPRATALNGLGIPTMQPVPPAQGAIPGVAGSHLAGPGGGGPPVSLLGQPSAAQIHLLGVGGPPTHSLSSAYGATLLGAGR
jgi:hypothetical protein